jgi:hypothetical protein
MAKCILGDQTRGVPRHHSEDTVTIFHGSAQPALACGFHATYYLDEVYAATRGASDG